MDSLLFHAFVYLLAAVVAVPLATRFRLGSVLGYLLAGVLIGPHLLNLVGDRSSDVMHFAEFGVVMMLFPSDSNCSRPGSGRCAPSCSVWVVSRFWAQPS
jgi:Kef-type K+ transport system membrane component KefB